jgi:hypothetical protein
MLALFRVQASSWPWSQGMQSANTLTAIAGASAYAGGSPHDGTPGRWAPMFGFLRRSAPRPLTDAIRSAIEKDGMTPANPSQLRMVEVGGRYSDRKVTYFRVFDPSTAAQQSPDIRRYKDFDGFPGLVLRSGHVERDGTIVLTRSVSSPAAQPTVRTRAGRIVPALDATVASDEAVATSTPVTDGPSPAPRA